MPEIVFIEERQGIAPTTSGTTVPTTSSATPAKPTTSESTPMVGTSTETTDTLEQTVGTVTVTDPTGILEGGGQLPIISTVFSMSTVGGTKDPQEEQASEVEYVSTVTSTFDLYDPKEKLGSHDLRIKKELVEENLHPGDQGYYDKLQYVYQNLRDAEKAVEVSKNTPSYNDNMRRYNSIS